MRLPRFILNPAVVGWVRLWQRERRENQRLRRELLEWQNKFLSKVNVTPLFQPPPPPMEQPQPLIIGPSAKKAYLAEHAEPNAVPTAEQILSQAEIVSRRNGK